MRTKRVSCVGVVAVGFAVSLAAHDLAAQAVRIDEDGIGGVVSGPHGPEAGVWVIAETSDLPTRFVRIVAPMMTVAICCPTFPRRATPCGCAATGWWTRRRCRPPRGNGST